MASHPLVPTSGRPPIKKLVFQDSRNDKHAVCLSGRISSSLHLLEVVLTPILHYRDKMDTPQKPRHQGSGSIPHVSYPVQQYLIHPDRNQSLVAHQGTDPKTKSQFMANHLAKWENHWQSITKSDRTSKGALSRSPLETTTYCLQATQVPSSSHPS